MKKESLFLLIIIIIGIGMIVRTFFGGNGKKTITQDNPGIIETINNTGDNQNDPLNTPSTGNIEKNTTGNIKTDTEFNTIQADSGDTKNTIKVIMPKYFYTPGWNKFSKDLYKNHQIKLNFTLIDNLNSYRDLLSNPNFSEADLFLFPYDWHEFVKTMEFSPTNDIEGLFDNLISPLIKKEKIGFLPFAADPTIIYSSIQLPYNNFSEISNIVYSRESNIQLAFPIFFGITNEDYDNKGFSREYQDIIRYALLHYFQKYKDSNSLGTRINTNPQNNDELKNYNVENLNQILSIITQPECKDFPSICFQIYNFVGIRFGFLSDKDIVQNYFSRKESNFEKLSIYTVPFFSTESPIRIRGRGISGNIKDNNTINSISTFLLEYLNNRNDYDLRNSTISVFKKEGENLTNNQYIGSRGYILESGGDYMNTLRNSNTFRQLLEHQISANNFLKK